VLIRLGDVRQYDYDSDQHEYEDKAAHAKRLVTEMQYFPRDAVVAKRFNEFHNFLSMNLLICYSIRFPDGAYTSRSGCPVAM
jgi:hypothetical protein